MKWFTKFYNWARPDGYEHITIMAFIFLATAPIMMRIIPNLFLAVFATVVVCEILGLGKEIYDSKHAEHCAEWHDVICDHIGIILGLAIFFWIKILLI